MKNYFLRLLDKELVDRLPVIVSRAGVSKLLRVPKIPAGIGDAQASAVVQALEEWGLTDRVFGCSGFVFR